MKQPRGEDPHTSCWMTDWIHEVLPADNGRFEVMSEKCSTEHCDARAYVEYDWKLVSELGIVLHETMQPDESLDIGGPDARAELVFEDIEPKLYEAFVASGASVQSNDFVNVKDRFEFDYTIGDATYTVKLTKARSHLDRS